ncbi:hypothetical protein BD413DRAFT_609581 [Trametes elegans]|nr:hypothetical protein BD413DRAFT_609581 [Trametes elegans]
MCELLVSAEHMAEHYRKAHKWPGLRRSKVKVLCEWAGCTKAICYGNLKKHIEDMHLFVRSAHCPHCHSTWRPDDRMKVHPRLADECEVRERALRGNAPTKAYSMETCAWCNTWLDGPSTFPQFDKESEYATIIGPVE